MSLIDCIKNSLGGDVGEPKFRAVLFGENAGYFENVLGIKCYSPCQILLFIKGNELAISGENLKIKKFCGGDLAVCGKILKVEVI